MDPDIFSNICSSCGGICCIDARPPLTEKRAEMLISAGLSPDGIEYAGYRRLRARDDGSCVLLENGRCRLHHLKPETCSAGPFTFDVVDGKLEIYLKKESICPLAGYLLSDREAYERQLKLAVERILDLVGDMSKDELAEVLRIEEPETFKVMEIDLNDRHRA
ncbi:MAG: YkgJ family cysteine cluster protein [Methanothrix sp.]|nr:YkgJ family cysteine cluster protein [Methanothrix sp.]MCX8207342.1 YkgJ family cysteine cluster protein [Methanothrix sp.]